MGIHYIKKNDFKSGEMVGKAAIDKAHKLVKTGVAGAKAGVDITKKLVSEQPEKLKTKMNEAADKIEELMAKNKEIKLDSDGQIENADEAVKELVKMCNRNNSTLMAIENGERFGWLTSDGWKELKLNRITEHGLVEAVSGDTLITIQPGALVLYKDTEEFKETLEFAKKITGKGRMITCEEYDEMHNKFTKLQVEKDKKLEAIKNGANFGILSGWGDGEYYPLVYKETLDEKNGLIRAYEESVRKVHYEYVVNLYVEGYSE